MTDNLKDPVKIVPVVNKAIARFTKGQVEATQALSSGDLVLQVDSEQTRQELHKKGGWIEGLGVGAQLNQPQFTVMVKAVCYNALDCIETMDE